MRARDSSHSHFARQLYNAAIHSFNARGNRRKMPRDLRFLGSHGLRSRSFGTDRGPLPSPLLALFVILLLSASAPSAFAQAERILDYHSDIQVHSDGSMVVTEQIRFTSVGRQIRHGIFREFPTRYTDRLRNQYVVGFDLRGATCDGSPVPTRLQDMGNGKRIYLGSSSALLPNGEHACTITYATSRQLGFFADHDELFWNVTGLGWSFAIEHASASVSLPSTIPADQVRLSGYTGPQGSMAQDLTSSSAPDGHFEFSSLHPLGPREGLTILLMWPKGFVAPPSSSEKLGYFFSDNRAALVPIGGLLAVLVYYLVVWAMVGRDPAAGTIVTTYDPPVGLSPAAMRYLVQMGYDDKVFTSAVLNMAVKGFLQIEQLADTYTIRRAKASWSVLSPDEKAAAEILFSGPEAVVLKTENHTLISSAIAALKSSLATAEDKVYFVTNSRYMIPAVVISIAMVAGLAFAEGPQKGMIAGFMCIWLCGWTVGVAGLLTITLRAWKLRLSGVKGSTPRTGGVITLTLFSLPFLGGEIAGLVMLAVATSVLIAVALLLTFGLHILFHYLLKAPTRAGRTLLDRVEGFKRFLGAVEGDRMDRINPPDKTPQVFEKFLPYALALDVQQAWADQFSGVLGASGQAVAHGSGAYSPSWYSGAGWSSLGAAGFADSLGGSFSSAISSASSAPGSSSGGGGGGGGSGGGGGGGGGGGW